MARYGYFNKGVSVIKIENGLHERLVEVADLANLNETNSQIESVSNFEDQRRLVGLFLESKIATLLSRTSSSSELLAITEELSGILGTRLSSSDEGSLHELRWYTDRIHLDRLRLSNSRPLTPLTQQALFTNARDEPRIDSEIEKELASADSVEILVSFIKMSGLRLLETQLRNLRDREIPVRVVTTTYMGATDKKAIDRLVEELGARVRIDLLPNSNRLHAKAWLFNRDSGYSTAIIGSSNMSQAALTSGSEWNVRLSEIREPGLLEKFRAAFETYWESSDYIEYTPATLGDALEEALSRQSANGSKGHYLLPQLEVTARPHQVRMLEELRASREVFGHTRNLVVAATGTGKTVLAALDYKSLILAGQPRPRLLFVAHRKEILQQALMTFRQVLGDAQFGDLFVDGMKPNQWSHVFASIQSLSLEQILRFGKDHFQHLVVDEFHHAEASSYKKLFKVLEAAQVVGLTATPERTDGLDAIWIEEFGGRIASELRLWDAMGQDLLAPFHYFGIGEEINFKNLPWVGGKYDNSALSELITSNTFRNRRVLRELSNRLPDIGSMKALVFCVSVDHARQVAKDFSLQGVATIAVTGTTKNRETLIEDLKTGKIQALATVDVFNEGVDIPEIDTIVLLRPTESPNIFLQQIGRGLRRFPGKDHVLILDFIGAHRAEYRVDKKFEALAGNSRSAIIKNVNDGFPFLPSGSSIQLDSLARDFILDLIKRQISPNWRKLVAEIRSHGHQELSRYLEASGRDLFEIYNLKKNRNWTSALSEANLYSSGLDDRDRALLGKIPRLLHLDDALRLKAYFLLATGLAPKWNSASLQDRKFASMFFWNLFDDGKNPLDNSDWDSIDEALEWTSGSKAFVHEISNLFPTLRERIRKVGRPFSLLSGESPLTSHATYSRFELLGALGYARIPGSSIYESGERRTLSNVREGVYHVKEARADLLLITLQKSETLSPSIRYHDYAVSPDLFHWESQNRTSVESATGQRYINQTKGVNDVLIAVRKRAEGPNGTLHFSLLGPADYVRHQGSSPIKIWWRLRTAMDPEAFDVAAAAKVG